MTEAELRYHLIEYLGLSVSSFNSGFKENIHYTDQTRQSTLIHNWFLPPKTQFPKGFKTRIGEWSLQPHQLRSFDLREFGDRPPLFAAPVVFAPETMPAHWNFLHQTLGPPDRLYRAYLTPSGRSYWVLGDDQRAFGLKFHSVGDNDTDAIVKRSFDADMIFNTVQASEALQNENSAMWENYGCFLTPVGENSLEFGFIHRDFKWQQLQAEFGDIILPLPALLSQSFWQSGHIREQLGLPDPEQTDLRNWFTENLAPHFAELLARALFQTGLHPEVHQQNLSVHLRDGEVINLIFQDLQDCLPDTVTQFLLANQQAALTPDITALKTRRGLALPGEILTPGSKEKLYVPLADWWRRWLRIFGRYDRIMNVLGEHDPFAETLFEDKMCLHFRRFIEMQGLPGAPEGFDLYQLMTLAQYDFQQKLLQKFFENFYEKATALQNPIHFGHHECFASARAPWTENTLGTWQSREQVRPPVQFTTEAGTLVLLAGRSSNHIYFFRS